MLLADQDHSLWDLEEMSGAGPRSTARWLSAAAGPYVLQAAIATLHTEDEVDWPQIAALYEELPASPGHPWWSSIAPPRSPRGATRSAHWR